MPEDTPAPPQVRAISEDRLMFARSDHTEWHFSAPAGTLPEVLLQSDYWKHVAGSNKPVKERDIIVAECEDRSWMATFTVRDIGPHHIKLAIVKPDSDGVCWFNKVDDLSLETETHYVKWVNIGDMHVVKRKSDNETIENRFRTPELAAAWMHKHIRDIAA